jgi:hypothetical protein
VISSLGGSKGALLTYLEIIIFVRFRKDIISPAGAQVLNRVLKGLALAAVGLAIVVLYISIHNPLLAAGALAQRVLYSGDVIIYYYRPEVMRDFAALNPFSFVVAMLNPILGELRLADYQYPLGYQMLLSYWKGGELPSTILGPNTPFFVVGHIYFGWFFGIVYSGCVGYLVSWVRSACLSVSSTTPLYTAMTLTLAIIVFEFPSEAPLFVSVLSDTLVPLLGTMALVASARFILRFASVSDNFISQAARVKS